MKWVRLYMRFPGTCRICGKGVRKGKHALWAKGVGVKHIECAEAEAVARKTKEIPCIICGGPAGCGQCGLAGSCDVQKVSQLCICSGCDSGGAIHSYRAAAARKFPVLK